MYNENENENKKREVSKKYVYYVICFYFFDLASLKPRTRHSHQLKQIGSHERHFTPKFKLAHTSPDNKACMAGMASVAGVAGMAGMCEVALAQSTRISGCLKMVQILLSNGPPLPPITQHSLIASSLCHG